MIKTAIVKAGLTATQAHVIGGTAVGSLTAIAGPAQKTAAICPASINTFTAVPLNGACILGAPKIGSVLDTLSNGDDICICNYGVNDLFVFPSVSRKINNGPENGAVVIFPNTCASFKKISTVDYGQH